MSKNQKDINKENTDFLKRDFVAFLFVLWAALKLPKPTKCQILMARMLQNGITRRFILQAFRGIGKSFITCGFVVWRLWNDPQMKIMIVSASKERADANSIFIKNIINLLPFLRELNPRPEQRDSVISFDVGPALPDHSPSVKSVGITGQLAGSRADLIIGDDVEIPNNSMTQTARDKLWELVKEFDAILKPNGTVLYLGTPQCEMTLYRELENRGYNTVIWPARYPKDMKEFESYGERLDKTLAAEFLENPEAAAWTPTDPVRFDNEDLRERELSYGKAGFALQFMLNPSLSDAEKYPLKLRDFIVAALGRDKAPATYQWMPHASNEVTEVPNVGLRGDRFYRYHTAAKSSHEFLQKIMVIDPSGRGKDETAYSILYTLNGYAYLMEVSGFRGGYEDKTLKNLALKAKEWNVQTVVIESNFGDGMFTKIFNPVLLQVHKAAIEEYRSKGQKEVRICDTIEPVLGNHRLVVRDEAIQYDYTTARDQDGSHDHSYSFFYQVTRMSRTKGAIAHDDRLDAVAIGLDWLKETMVIDDSVGLSAMTAEYLEMMMSDERKGFSAIHTVDLGDVTIKWEDDKDSNRFINF